MMDIIRQLVRDASAHPAAFGFVAGFARWVIGDREGGWRALFVHLVTSVLVAAGASFWLVDEAMTSGRKSFWLLLVAFVAKDVLTAIIGLSTQFGSNPLEVIRRIRAAIAGGPTQ